MKFSSILYLYLYIVYTHKFALSQIHTGVHNDAEYSGNSVNSSNLAGLSFPEDFLLGVASSAYQIEGGWNADGKGENIWDNFVHTKPEFIKNGSTGDESCDSYHLFKEDVAILKEIGFQVYRFSISWSRILPNGEITNVNEAGVKYYHSLIDELLKNGIQPMITIYHWDLPQPLQVMGGWLNPLIIDYMEDYADLLFQLYGEKVKLWITMNEPRLIVKGYSRYVEEPFFITAPKLQLDSPANYIAIYNLLRAHARIYRLYDKKFRESQKGKVAIVLNSSYYVENSTSQEDMKATERAWAFRLGLYAHPIFSKEGDFPKLVKEIVSENSKREGRRRSRLPQFTLEEIESIKGSSDFFGLNHYTTYQTSAERPPHSKFANPDVGVKFKFQNYLSNRKMASRGMREVLRFIKDNYNNPPVFITENGYCDKRDILNDEERINYFKDYLREVLIAKEKFGCNVMSYIVWTLLDNFEWSEGYMAKCGIYTVNFTDPRKIRTPKLSAKFFKELLKTRTVPE